MFVVQSTWKWKVWSKCVFKNVKSDNAMRPTGDKFTAKDLILKKTFAHFP